MGRTERSLMLPEATSMINSTSTLLNGRLQKLFGRLTIRRSVQWHWKKLILKTVMSQLILHTLHEFKLDFGMVVVLAVLLNGLEDLSMWVKRWFCLMNDWFNGVFSNSGASKMDLLQHTSRTLWLSAIPSITKCPIATITHNLLIHIVGCIHLYLIFLYSIIRPLAFLSYKTLFIYFAILLIKKIKYLAG